MAALAGSVLPVYPHDCGRMGLGGAGALSREHGIMARMGSVLLHPCRPSVKMLRCCDGAAGANGRRMGVGWHWCWVQWVSSQTLYDELDYCGACKMEGSTTLGRDPSWGSMLCTLGGELDRAKATVQV